MDAFDVVVIGSGFGGSVTAERAAATGASVCVLERGRAYPPNSFARSPYSMNRAFWDPGHGRTGLFDVWSFRRMTGVVSAGLGGGSLVYANVLIRKDERWFDNAGSPGSPEPWPVSRADLDPHYDAVERVVAPQVFPMHQPPYDKVTKVWEFRRAAVQQGFEPTTYDAVDGTRPQWYLPLLGVTFGNPGRPPVPGETIAEDVRNLHDRDRQTCRMVGECDLGCNYGSKNSLDYNYLTLAHRHGARLRTLCEVKTFAPDGTGGIVVSYRQYEPVEEVERSTGPTPYTEVTVRGRHVVLAAGTFGTNLLLQRNQAAFPGLSRRLGHGISGNGDLLTLVLDAKKDVDGHRRNRVLDPSYGPVITSTLRSPDALDGGGADAHGFYLQDAGYPVFVDWLVQTASRTRNLAALAAFGWDRLKTHVLHRGSPHLAPSLVRLLGDSHLSAGSMPMLGMGRDVPDGVLSLDRDGDLVLRWDKRGSSRFFDHAIAVSKGMAGELDGRFVLNPVTALFNRFVTVHPLGGCAMGTTAEQGVVDVWGRVHGHPNLHVVDGAVLPGPVGANPSLTIAALADRFADQLIEDLGSRPYAAGVAQV